MTLLKQNSVAVVLGRTFWIMFGPLLLTASGGMIIASPGAGWRTGADITYLVTLACMIISRWLEFAGGNPRRSTGEPATLQDIRRFTLLMLVGGVTFFVIANVISNYLLA
jgi:hypothetical protein